MPEMNSDLVTRILSSIKDKYGTSKTRSNENTLQNLICPVCRDESGWCYLKNPWAIMCNRANECKITTKTKDLFPEIFKTIEKAFPPVDGDLDKPARLYLQSRGLRESIKGLSFSYWKDIRKTGSGGVMFPVGRDETGKTVYNGRLFSPPQNESKAHNHGSISGLYWSHPGRKIRKINPDEPIILTEGVISALSLIEAGYQAIAILTSGQAPTKLRLESFKKIILGFDNDQAGQNATRRYLDHFRTRCDISAILPDKGKDWNDILQEAPIQDIKGYFESRMRKFKFNADLALSQSAQEYLDKYVEFKGFSPQLFEFNGGYFYAKPRNKGDGFYAVEVADFTVQTDYYLLDETIKDRRVYRYGLTIKPRNREKIQALFDARDLATTKDLTTSMLTRARCSWNGDGAATRLFCTMITRSNARELRQLTSLGYDEKTDSYVFPEFMITPSGEMTLPENGLFHVPWNTYIRPAQFKSLLPVPGISARDIWFKLYAAWGNRAAVATAWTVAGWFVHHVRRKAGFYPYLSIFFDKETGKTSLMRFLSRMQAIDEEPFSMSKSDTNKGLTRKLSHKSSLFLGISELNKDEKLKFPLESILTWYDGSPLSTKAAFTGGNEVIETPFRSSIMFCQNTEPFETPAQKSRVVSLKFEQETMTPETNQAVLDLLDLPAGKLAHFFVQVMQHRKMIEESWFEEYMAAKQDLYNLARTTNRLTEIHGLVLAFHRVLCRVIGIDHDLTPFMADIMKQKHLTVLENDTGLSDLFFAEAAAILRTCQMNRTQSYLHFMDYDSETNRLWIHFFDLVRSSQSMILSRHPVDKIANSLKDHPAFVCRDKTHRFKFYKADTREYSNQPKKGWCFDCSKLTDEFDIDLRSLHWL